MIMSNCDLLDFSHPLLIDLHLTTDQIKLLEVDTFGYEVRKKVELFEQSIIFNR